MRPADTFARVVARAERWVRVPEGVGPGRYVAVEHAGDALAPVIRDRQTVLVRLTRRVHGHAVVLVERDTGRLALRLWGPRSRGRKGERVVGRVVVRWNDPAPS